MAPYWQANPKRTGPVTVPTRTRGEAMGVRVRPVAGTAGLLLAVGVLVAPATAGALHYAGNAQAATNIAGTGYAAPARSVTVSGANARARALLHSRAEAMVPPAPLGRNGRPAGGALAARAPAGTRSMPRTRRPAGAAANSEPAAGPAA